MPARIIERVVADLWTGAGGRAAAGDAGLLDAFLAQRDQAAFAALVQRHGPMVLGVCRRILGHAQDAEDAFQAVFWVLARKAASVRPRAWVGNWLYGVAVRTALKARALRRRRREYQVDAMPPQPASSSQAERDAQALDVQAILDEEIERLPAKYRLAVVLCELEGQGRKEAAAQLGIPEGTLSSRLAHARRVLGRRLHGRGVTLGAGGVAALLAEHGAAASLPYALLSSTVHSATANSASVAVASLAKGVMAAMFLSKLKKTAVALFLCAAALGLGLGARSLWADDEAAAQAPPAGAAKPKLEEAAPGKAQAKSGKPALAADDSVLGVWRVLRIDTDGDVVEFDLANEKVLLRITPDMAFSRGAPGVAIMRPLKIGPGTLDWGPEPGDPEDSVTRGIYALEANRLRLYFGKPKGPRPTNPKDASQTWTLMRQPSRQQVYQQLESLQGTWKAVAGEFNGEGLLPRELASVELHITEDHWQISPPSEPGQPDALPSGIFNRARRFVLDSGGTGSFLVLRADGIVHDEVWVLYELGGDQLKVCWYADWPIAGQGQGEFVKIPPPAELKTTANSGLVLFALKRQPALAPNFPSAPNLPGAPKAAAPDDNAVPLPATKVQVRITGPEGMKVRLIDAKEDKVAPARLTFDKGGVYRLRLSNIAKRPGKVYYPTVEIPAIQSPHAAALLANTYIPIELSEDLFDLADDGAVATRYCWVADEAEPPPERIAMGQRVTVGRQRPLPDEKGVMLAIVRLGGIDLEDGEPNAKRER